MFKLIIFLAITIHIFNVPSVAPFYILVGFVWFFIWSIGVMLSEAICSVTKTCRK